MKRLLVLTVVGLLGVWASPAAAQVKLDFQDGKVHLQAQGVSVSQILGEWAKRGRTTIINGDRIPGPAVTIELQDIAEQSALDVILRNVSGYLVAPRENSIAGASVFDRIYILPTSARPTNAAPLPPQQAIQQVQDDFDDDEPLPAGARPGVNPGARLPRDVVAQPGAANRTNAALEPNEEREPENRPAAAPSNPFGVAPGTSRPGVINPAPTPTRRDQ